MYKTKEKALISGMNGFIGSHLARALKQRDIDPIGIPREILYQPYPELMAFVRKQSPQYIFHLAGYGNHGHQHEEDKIVMANYFATWNLLQASKYINYKAFVNVSTSSVYGKKTKPMSEVDYVTPDTFYASTKASSMYLARAYTIQYKKPVVSVIPFSVFGEGEADFRFIPTACKHLVTGERMPFVKSPTHDWIYVKDFVNGMLTIVDNIEKVKGEWVNVGTGVSRSNVQVVTMLEKIAGKELNRSETYKEQPHHSGVWVADNAKLLSLGWKPNYSFEEALKATWLWYQIRYAK